MSCLAGDDAGRQVMPESACLAWLVTLASVMGMVFTIVFAATSRPGNIQCPIAPEYRWPALYAAAGVAYLLGSALVVRLWGPVVLPDPEKISGGKVLIPYGFSNRWVPLEEYPSETHFLRVVAWVFFPAWVTAKIVRASTRSILVPRRLR